MSGPNTSYDPVQVTPLDAAHVEAMVNEALAAFAAAALGGRAEAGPARPRGRPVTDRAGQPGDRCAAAAGPQGRRVADRPGPGPDQPGAAGAGGRAQGGRAGPDPGRGAGRCHPAGHPRADRGGASDHGADEPDGGRLRRHGLGGRRGAGARGGVAQLRRAQLHPRPPGADHAGHVVRRAGRRRPGAADPHLAGPGAHHADPGAADLRGMPGPGLPGRRVRRDPPAGVPPDRGAGGRQGDHARSPAGHPRPLRPGDVRRDPDPDAARTTSPSPSRRPRSTCSASSATAPRSATPTTRAGPARARAGSSGAAAGWSTRGCCRPAASIPTSTPGSRSAWGSTAR